MQKHKHSVYVNFLIQIRLKCNPPIIPSCPKCIQAFCTCCQLVLHLPSCLHCRRHLCCSRCHVESFNGHSTVWARPCCWQRHGHGIGCRSQHSVQNVDKALQRAPPLSVGCRMCCRSQEEVYGLPCVHASFLAELTCVAYTAELVLQNICPAIRVPAQAIDEKCHQDSTPWAKAEMKLRWVQCCDMGIISWRAATASSTPSIAGKQHIHRRRHIGVCQLTLLASTSAVTMLAAAPAPALNVKLAPLCTASAL